MRTIRLGKTKMKITKAGFGGIPIQRLAAQDAVAVVRGALDLGINWIDTSTSYGTSEEHIGRAVAGYDRSAIRLFTKGPGKTSEQIGQQIALSMQRLRVTYFDLYQFHLVPSEKAWVTMQNNGTLDTVRRMRDKGIIHHIGASAHTLDAALALLDHPEIEVIQWPFNFIVVEDGEKVLKQCRAKDIGFIAMKPFGGGMLDNAQACVRFQLRYPEVVFDPGFESVGQIREVVALCQKQTALTQEDYAVIRRLKAELGKSFCRRCGYCMPCPNGVAIIPLMTVKSFMRRFHPQRLLSGNYPKAIATHTQCTECGECEEKCPYNLEIIKGIQEGAAAFEKFRKEQG
jgi:predicted aldo/keto reductase-like oxidoreductase